MVTTAEIVKRQYDGSVRVGLDPDYVYGIAVDVYEEELERDGGEGARERWIKSWREHFKCPQKIAEQAFKDNAQTNRTVLLTLTALKNRGELKTKVIKSPPVKGDFNKDYVYQLSADVSSLAYDRYAEEKGLKVTGKAYFIKEHMKENGSTRERAEQRFNDKAQNHAPVVRSVLKALQLRGQLPKGAAPKEK